MGFNSYYSLNKESKIVIYGVNTQSRELVKLLLSKGFEILAFLDKRAGELIQVDGIPVHEMSRFSVSKEDNAICAIIALNNAMQHDKIAFDLFDKGLNKIIFAPMRIDFHKKYAGELREIYNQVLLGNIEQVKEIPYYEMLINDNENINTNIYNETENYITVQVEADIVYTSTKEQFESMWDLKVLPVTDIPLVMLKQQHQILEYFWGGEFNISLTQYLNDLGVNSCNYTNAYTDEQIICQRAKLYELWNEHFCEGLDFFISSAPLAKWNNKGYFNLSDGHHRSVFLLKKGVYYLPIRICRHDWEKWKNAKIIESNNFRQCVAELSLHTPIPNPFFQKKSFYNKISIIESMLLIQKNLPGELYKNKTVLCIDNMYGYYGFNLRRMGAKNVILYAQDGDQKRMMEQLTQLYELSQINTVIESIWSEPEHPAVVLAIGGIEIQSLKHDIFKKYINGKIEALLIAFTERERELIDDDIEQQMIQISKVFEGSEILGIYLLRGRL